ncbi:MAG: UDP-N-acetylmuramoyl-L-alanyl-D-glutamate--2,6-diaminopimelate ligase [Actinobacteria bacterium]|nr:MAG: UDP-N-acetylmuramoyl-L-alanyl-D-glutamate--2,6-diaminopimelate ligase [Actinomycetota bacterium]
MTPAGRRVGSPAVELPLPAVTLSDAAAAVRAEVRGDDGRSLTDASYDSRTVEPDSLFFCIVGEHLDGHRFAREAVAAGAGAIVVERWLPVDAPQALVPSVRGAIGPMSSVLFGRPAEALTTIGITGTNGKTTTTYLLEAIIRASGSRAGVIGTNGARIDGSPVALARTTPEAPDLHRLLARMRSAGVRMVAMEVSSHALAQQRVDGVVFDVAVFTNLSPDHLDYHGTMRTYLDAKAALFTPSHAARGVLNADDPSGRALIGRAAIPVVTFGIDRDADLRASDVAVDAGGISFRVEGVEVRSTLRGGFNVSNCLAAMGSAREVGIPLDTAADALGEVRDIPGRMETIDAGQEFLVVVDYAHTPDSIRVVLRGARSLAAGRVIVVFGCGGDRDRAKRSPMGRAATSSADLTVITTDNPRSEDPLAIIREIVPGAVAGGGEYVVEPDRRAAIRLGVREAKPGDIVVIAGKGHEPYQEVAGAAVPFDDRSIARDELGSLLEGA